MYSPYQEVPSTPALLIRLHTSEHLIATPEAVVPDVYIDQGQDQSVSVLGTPVASIIPSSPWTPNVRSLSRSQRGRRFTYNPALSSRFLPMSPAVAASPKEQVVPSTPVGGFLYPRTPNSSRREVFTMKTPTQNCYFDDIVAAGDRPRQGAKTEELDENNNSTIDTPRRLRPRGQKEIVARFRRSPEAAQEPRDGLESHDFLDLI